MTSPPNDPDKARRKLILDAFDAALDQPEGERAAWLRQTYHDDAQLVAAVEALLTADAMAPSAMPTELDEGGETTLLVPPARIGAYQLVSKLGGGGMGEVWLGLRDDGLFEHEVAIKLMRPSRIASAALAFFNTERRALARLRHHHIARLFDGGVTPEGLPWIIMERIEGDTLDGWMRATKPAEAEAVRVMIAVAEAVQYAHQQLVVHADLKPSNILVDSTGEPSLVDFGMSRRWSISASRRWPCRKRRTMRPASGRARQPMPARSGWPDTRRRPPTISTRWACCCVAC
ncbi:MAG: serine/threonine-protein kinase [Asticcacaulis sp.]